jgi:hypothetical protein
MPNNGVRIWQPWGWGLLLFFVVVVVLIIQLQTVPFYLKINKEYV